MFEGARRVSESLQEERSENDVIVISKLIF